MNIEMHVIQEALYQLTGLCESYRLTHCLDILYGVSEGDVIFSQVSWISLIKLLNMCSIQSRTVFFIAFINAYHFGIAVRMYM